MAETGFDKERIDKFYRGEYSENDESYVRSVFCDDGKKIELEKLLSDQYNEFLPDNKQNNKNLENILHRINFEINDKQADPKSLTIDRVVKWTLRIAAVLIIPIVLFSGVHFYKILKENALRKETWVEIKASAWTRAQFSLPDGTHGWLNSQSSIKYNGNFIRDRQVILNGEAFFDVIKDKSRPFIVNTNEVKLKVLGTRFNIASFNNEKNVEVVLEEGEMVFNTKATNKSYKMKPSDLVVYDKTSRDFYTEVVQTQKYLSWTEGKLVFRNDPLDVITKRLERWYDVDIELAADPSLTDIIRWRATFIDEDLEEVLNFMRLSLPVNYKIENPILDPNEIYSKKRVIITLKQV